VAFVSVTRLRLSSLWQFPAFLLTANAAATQAQRSSGFIRGALGYETGRAFWTVTVWLNADHMLAYRNHGSHLAAMPKLLGWCDEASFVNWEQTGTDVPSPAEAVVVSFDDAGMESA
jgi:hypothetical protein